MDQVHLGREPKSGEERNKNEIKIWSASVKLISFFYVNLGCVQGRVHIGRTKDPVVGGQEGVGRVGQTGMFAGPDPGAA